MVEFAAGFARKEKPRALDEEPSRVVPLRERSTLDGALADP
jgi:hypothetical protein